MPHEAYVGLQGAWVDTVPTAGGTIVSPTYLATVTDGVLTLELAGINTYVGGARRRTGLDIEGLTITPRRLPRPLRLRAGRHARGLGLRRGRQGHRVQLKPRLRLHFVRERRQRRQFGLAQQRWSESGFIYATTMTFQVNVPDGNST